jgi:hypothetical protein
MSNGGDWFDSNAPQVTAQPSRLPGAPPQVTTQPSKLPGAIPQRDWFADNDPNKPLSSADALSRTLSNMTRAMSGQPMENPEDQAAAEKGRREGFESAGVTFLTSLGGELLAAPKLLQVAARDPATGQFVKGLATKEGPTLLAEGMDALQAAGEAHPLVKQALIQGLTMLGAGKVAHWLGWLGKTAP